MFIGTLSSSYLIDSTVSTYSSRPAMEIDSGASTSNPTRAHFPDYIVHPPVDNSGSCVSDAATSLASVPKMFCSLICLTFISLLGIPLLFCFGEFNIRGILRVILRLIHIFKLDSLGELLLFYTVYHSVLLLLDGVCRKEWGEHITPLGRGDFHIYIYYYIYDCRYNQRGCHGPVMSA